MTIHKTWGRRIAAAVLIAIGLVLGVTWNDARFCIGDELFLALGLPAWSKGTTGLHYPAVSGSILILIGLGMVNSTLEEKARRWIGLAILLLLFVWSLVFNFT